MCISSPRRFSLAILLLLVGAMVTTVAVLPELDASFIEQMVQNLGPIAIVLFVALGIVVSPIPSGVVALVAGGLYGTVEGGMLTILGAGLGASCAFGLSRHLGRGHLVASQTSIARLVTRERSQAGLMMTVFLTRLVPFISFDAISYLAGLTPLAFWRFLVATVLGTAPVCFAFAAAGNTASNGTVHPALLIILSGITLLLPAGAMILRVRRLGWTQARTSSV